MRRFGDRYDGRRIRHGDPLNTVIPFIMKDRSDSQVFFDAEIDVSKIDEIIREKRKSGENVGFLDYLIAVVVRTISQYPRMNRFVAGRRIFARNEIAVSMAVKREHSINAEETTVKFKFAKDAVREEVSKLIRKEIEKCKGENAEKNSTDSFVRLLNHLPRWLYSFIVNTVIFLDFHGIMPKFIHELSPFHTSVFVTNFGSLGAEPIYHHIYNFGTTSIFIAFGNRKVQRGISKDGNLVQKKIMKLRFVADERIADGFYLASSMKYLTWLFEHPEELEIRPEQVFEDDQI